MLLLALLTVAAVASVLNTWLILTRLPRPARPVAFLTLEGDQAMESLTLGKPFNFKIVGLDDKGQPTAAPLPGPVTVTIDGTAFTPDANGVYSFTPAAASGEIDAACAPLPPLADPYTANAPVAALGLVAV